MAAGIVRHGALVAAFIEAGELAQGVADAEFAARGGCDGRSPAGDAALAFLTRLAAFVRSSWDSGFAELRSGADGGARGARARRRLPEAVEVKRAEGFAFYALYPEAYLAAARAAGLPSGRADQGDRHPQHRRRARRAGGRGRGGAAARHPAPDRTPVPAGAVLVGGRWCRSCWPIRRRASRWRTRGRDCPAAPSARSRISWKIAASRPTASTSSRATGASPVRRPARATARAGRGRIGMSWSSTRWRCARRRGRRTGSPPGSADLVGAAGWPVGGDLRRWLAAAPLRARSRLAAGSRASGAPQIPAAGRRQDLAAEVRRPRARGRAQAGAGARSCTPPASRLPVAGYRHGFLVEEWIGDARSLDQRGQPAARSSPSASGATSGCGRGTSRPGRGRERRLPNSAAWRGTTPRKPWARRGRAAWSAGRRDSKASSRGCGGSRPTTGSTPGSGSPCRTGAC